MVEPRRGLRIAIVMLRAFALGGVIFALSFFGGAISQLLKREVRDLPGLLSLSMVGLAVAAVFYLLSEAGVVLLSLEEQGAFIRQELDELKSEPAEECEKEKE